MKLFDKLILPFLPNVKAYYEPTKEELNNNSNFPIGSKWMFGCSVCEGARIPHVKKEDGTWECTNCKTSFKL